MCEVSEGCSFARCVVGDEGCYFACEEGECKRVLDCEDASLDCISRYQYDSCEDPNCNSILLNGYYDADGNWNYGDWNADYDADYYNTVGSSANADGSNADGSSANGATSGTFLTRGSSFMSAMAYIIAALVASIVIASVLLHRVSFFVTILFLLYFDYKIFFWLMLILYFILIPFVEE